MGEIFVVAEHRQGELREITLEMLYKANELSQALSHTLTAIMIGAGDEAFVDDLTKRADRVIAVEDERLRNFDADLQNEILRRLIEEYRPFLTLMGHTAWGMDLAPSLSIKSGLPLATDCVDIRVEEGRPIVIRQIYSGKLFSRVAFKESEGYLITVRPGAFPPDEIGERNGELVRKEIPSDLPEARKQFVEFLDAGAGEIDIGQADLLVSIGRGIGEQENIEEIKELAELMGGVISCSRPVVDKNWLPKYHQVGTSGKSVKPMLSPRFISLWVSVALSSTWLAYREQAPSLRLTRIPRHPYSGLQIMGLWTTFSRSQRP